MPTINVQEVKPGMTAAEDVMASNKRLLIPKGTVIEKKHIRVMNIWGVTELSIVEDAFEDKSDQAAAPENGKALEACWQYVNRIFVDHDLAEKASAELYRLKMLDQINKYNQGWRPQDPEGDAPADDKIHYDKSDSPRLKDLIKKEIELISPPDIYLQLNRVLENISASGDHIAEVVGRDPGIAAKLLKIVNSPIYGKPGKVDSLKQAVFLLGARALTELVLGISLVDRFKGNSTNRQLLRKVWIHSIACGVIARVLASYRKDLDPERCFLGGLLHDIGRIILFKQIPRRMADIYRYSKKNQIPLHIAEERLLGFNHSLVGEELFRHWNFPIELINIVGRHHNPVLARDMVETSLIHLADIISIVNEYGLSASQTAPFLAPQAWEALNLPISVLAATISKSRRQIADMIDIMLE